MLIINQERCLPCTDCLSHWQNGCSTLTGKVRVNERVAFFKHLMYDNLCRRRKHCADYNVPDLDTRPDRLDRAPPWFSVPIVRATPDIHQPGVAGLDRRPVNGSDEGAKSRAPSLGCGHKGDFGRLRADNPPSGLGWFAGHEWAGLASNAITRTWRLRRHWQ